MSGIAENCKRIVREKYPLSEIRPIGIQTFQVFSGDKVLGHMCKNADAAWTSAFHILQVNE